MSYNDFSRDFLFLCLTVYIAYNIILIRDAVSKDYVSPPLKIFIVGYFEGYTEAEIGLL